MIEPKINSNFRRIEKRFSPKLSLGGGGGGGGEKNNRQDVKCAETIMTRAAGRGVGVVIELKLFMKINPPSKGDRFYYITFNTYFARFILVFFKVSEIF